MRVYVVLKSTGGSYFYKEDYFNEFNTYSSKPVAIFFSRSDADSYVRDKNRMVYDEDDVPDDSWAIVNGYA